MPRATPTSNPKKRSRKYAKKTSIAPDNLKDLQGKRETEVSKYNKVKNTDSAYSGQRSRGRGFLKNLIAKRRQDEINGPNDDGICTATLEKAFDDGAPNKYSALALEMFLVQKCFNEGCGKDTADSIHGAFAALWDNMYEGKEIIFNLCFTDLKNRDGGHYAGAYTYDEATGEIKGCPARARSVKAVIQSVKTREKSKGSGATRNHAEAMSLEELQHLMQWSTKQCPDEWLIGENWRSEVQDSVEALKHRLQHGFMRGFMSSGFTLWTRSVVISHLLQLKPTGLNAQVF